ncbi:MAG: hypothetical protein ACFFC7_09810 [Candidatus Hermodarchaeota archaeon]
MNEEEQHSESSSSGEKNVTIRGIDSRVYDEFSHAIKSLGITLGEAISRMMGDVLKDFNGKFPELSSRFFRNGAQLPTASISGHGILSVNKKDLIEANARFSFSHIDQLTFEPDVTPETFTRHVRSIDHCDQVKIPSILPKLLVYSKIRRCESIEIYQV